MIASILLFFALFFQGGQGRQGGFKNQQPSPTPAATQGQTGGQQRPQPSPAPEEPPVVTKHSITVGGQTINYTATAGMMPIKNREGEVEARIFFTSYVVDGPKRPLTFSFNGGPGSASVWLHMGAIGPKRVSASTRFPVCG